MLTYDETGGAGNVAGATAGVRVTTPLKSNIVFLAFGFEGIDNMYHHLNGRKVVMKSILDWLTSEAGTLSAQVTTSPDPAEGDPPLTISFDATVTGGSGIYESYSWDFGDGATSEGDFHEAMNFAGVYHLPVVFFVQNNQWAISVPRDQQTASETIAQKAIAYGFDGLQLDGNDVLAIYAGTKETVEKARGGGGPSLIEAVTYRLGVHTTADDPKKYRSDEEVARWQKLDPIPRFHNYLVKRGVLDEKLAGEIESDVLEIVKAGVDRYEAGRDVDPLDCFTHMFSELPAELVEQREEFRQALEREGIAHGH
ncbi:MAG: hypothetical protein IIB61_07160 [Planctomycetes bacterium]|nr:hypothetical protein [Planctomycetota bacterium]